MLAIAWVGSLALAFTIGQGQDTQELSKNTAKATKEKVEAKAKEESKTEAPPFTTTVVRNLPINASQAMTESLPLLKRRSSYLDFSKMSKVYQNFENLSEAEIMEAFNYANEIESGQARSTFKAMLYSLWAEQNPEAALAHNKENNSSYSKSWTENTIISVWAKKDPSSAFDWYQSNLDDKPLTRNQYNNFLQPIFQEFAAQDLETALGKVSELSGRDKSTSFRGVLQSIDDPSTFISLIDRYGESKDSDLVQSTISAWTRNDPLQVIEWSQSLEDEEKAKEYEKKAREAWVKQDPSEAASWILEQAEEGKESGAINEIARSWNWRDSQGLSEWLKSQETELLSDKTYSSVAQRMSREDPYSAADWASQISNSDEKVKILKRIYHHSSRRDKEAATELIQNLGTLSEEEVDKILK